MPKLITPSSLRYPLEGGRFLAFNMPLPVWTDRLKLTFTLVSGFPGFIPPSTTLVL